MSSWDEILQQAIAGGLDFQPQTALVISSGVEVTIEKKNDGTTDFFKPVAYEIQSESECYYRWDASSGNTIDTAKDLKFPPDETVLIKVPFRLLASQDNNVSIFLHMKQVNSVTSKELRYVEV